MLETVNQRPQPSRGRTAPPAGVASDIVVEPRSKFRDLTPSEIELVTGGQHAHPAGTYSDFYVTTLHISGYRIEFWVAWHGDLVMLCQGGWVMTGAGGPSVWIEHIPQNFQLQNVVWDSWGLTIDGGS